MSSGGSHHYPLLQRALRLRDLRPVDREWTINATHPAGSSFFFRSKVPPSLLATFSYSAFWDTDLQNPRSTAEEAERVYKVQLSVNLFLFEGKMKDFGQKLGIHAHLPIHSAPTHFPDRDLRHE